LTSLAAQFILHLGCNGHNFWASGCWHLTHSSCHSHETRPAWPTGRQDDHQFIFYVDLNIFYSFGIRMQIWCYFVSLDTEDDDEGEEEK